MPTYTIGTNSKFVRVSPNSTATIVFKYLRGLQSIWVSNLTSPRANGAVVSNSYTLKVFCYMQEPSTLPSITDTANCHLAVADTFGYIPVNQLSPGGSAFVYVVIQNKSSSDTLGVWVTGES